MDSSKCPEYPNQEIVLWYKKVHTKQYFAQAREYCKQRDWRFFGEYNGTQAQVDWLFKEFGTQHMYLGIERMAGESEWVSDKDEDMTSLIASMLTGGDQADQVRRIILKRQNQIHSASGNQQQRNFICVKID